MELPSSLFRSDGEEEEGELPASGSEVPESERYNHWNPVYNFMDKMTDKYDTTFVVMLGMQYFNQGTKVLVSLASANLFKDYYELGPGYV